MSKEVKVIDIEGTEYYTVEASYFKNDAEAEQSGYYWDDEIGKWSKEIVDNTTTAF